ncbi:transcription factor SRM1-like [Curcuma longa]|uniref:transcription factor SRM1-like n=1 Tax=Curcuma longa TaxID=136217 RepID=UPI003D9F2E7D
MGRCGLCWTREEEKAFENGLAAYAEDCDDRWARIAADLPGKSVEEVKEHYELLVEDVDGIEAGRVPLPRYPSSSDPGHHGGRASPAERERRKGIAWTEDEHRLFLLGLNKYGGKGDWRSISRNFVVSRTPTQVASHAQKYFIRLNSMNKEPRRTSIHDITTAGRGDGSNPQGLTSGQVIGKPTKPSSQPSSSSGPSGVDNLYV